MRDFPAVRFQRLMVFAEEYIVCCNLALIIVGYAKLSCILKFLPAELVLHPAPRTGLYPKGCLLDPQSGQNCVDLKTISGGPPSIPLS